MSSLTWKVKYVQELFACYNQTDSESKKTIILKFSGFIKKMGFSYVNSLSTQTLILLHKLLSVFIKVLCFWCFKKLPQYPFSSHGKWRVEPLFKGATALENGWKKEVEKSPKFRQFVLQWSPSQQYSPRGHIVSIQDLSQLAVMVLHPMAFIYYHVFPSNLQEEKKLAKLEQVRLSQTPPNRCRTKIFQAWDISHSHLREKPNQVFCKYQWPCKQQNQQQTLGMLNMVLNSDFNCDSKQRIPRVSSKDIRVTGFSRPEHGSQRKKETTNSK